MTDAIAVLLVLSALAEAFGTVTVWLNYQRGADLARRLLADVQDEDEQDDYVRRQFSVDPALLIGNEAPYQELVVARKRLGTLRRDVGEQLARRWYLTAGLVAYVSGAVLGLAAGLVALVR